MCTACVVAHGGPVTAGKTFDYKTATFPDTRATAAIVSDGPLRYAGLLVNRQPGVNAGLNEAGVGSMITFCDDRLELGRVEELRSVVNHEILRSARTVVQALGVLEEFLSHRPGMIGGYFILFDTTGQIALVEQIRGAMRVHAQHGGTVYRTNHFFMFPGVCPPELLETRSTFLRYERAGRLLADRDTVTVADLARVFADHADGPSLGSICSHSEDGNTVASVIFQADTRVAWCLIGHPCEGEYTALAL
jgi:hypothetical protein